MPKQPKTTAKNTNPNAHYSISKLEQMTKLPNGLLLQTAETKLLIDIWSDGIVCINAIKKEHAFQNFSYSIDQTPQKTDFECNVRTTFIEIVTKKLIVHISKNPVRLTFLTPDKQIINQDDPTFGIGWIGNEVTNYKTIQDQERFIGLGEKVGNTDKKGHSFVHWNTDMFGYSEFSDPLYASFPFYMGVLPEIKQQYGIFFDNTYKSTFNFGASNDRFSYFQADNGELKYYFIYNDSIEHIIKDYTWLTGRIKLPPIWSLGFQQCRYSYYPDTEILQVAQTLRNKKMPCDVLYLDIHYMQDYKVFTWNDKHFSSPKTLISHLQTLGFKVVVIIDPAVKIEKDYPVYEQGIKENHFVKYPDGINYTCEVWPGKCHLPDFTKPDTRLWWGNLYKELTDMGIKGFWNDMNEPAVWGRSIPDLIEFDYDQNPTTHKQAHNIYGMQMARATDEGVEQLLKHEQRHFVLTRSAFAGMQRHAAVWTGDNCADESHLLLGMRLVANLGLVGVPFAGNDVGGFIGECSADLFARWIAVGCFTPFFRCHTMINSRDAEPYSFGEEAEDIARNFIQLRYRLLPYIYACFYEATQTGMPLNRSLAIDYTFDNFIYTYSNEFLFGNNLLICPIGINQKYEKIYLPQGEWFDFYNDETYAGGREIIVETQKDKLPVFVKSGAILPMQAVVQHTGEQPSDKTLQIHIYKGKQSSQFEYYEDDGQSYEFEKGCFYKRTIHYNAKKQRIDFDAVEGNFISKFETLRVYFHTNSPHILDGLPSVDYRFVEPISSFDPYLKAIDESKTIKSLRFIDVLLVNNFFSVDLKP